MKNKLYVLCLIILVACCLNTDVGAKTKYVKMKNKYNLKYNTQSKNQKLDIYYPKKTKAKKNKVIIFFHGGSYYEGNKRDYLKRNKNLFTKNGYVYVTVNYRLSKEAQFPAAIDDGKTAIRFLKANAKKYRLNPKKFMVVGHSAGANLGGMLSTTQYNKRLGTEKIKYSKYDNKVAGFIGIAGYYDYDLLYDTKRTKKKAIHKKIDKFIYNSDEEKYEKALTKANAINYYKGSNRPTLLLHGKKDTIIQINQTGNYCKALKKKNKKVRCKTNKKATHSMNKFTNKKNKKIILNWLNKNF